MASSDGSSLLDIPGAWVSKELDLELSPPVSLTQPSSIQPAYIRTSLEEPPPCCDPTPSSPTPIVVHSTPRTSYPTLGPCEPDPRVKKATFAMPIGLSSATEAISESVPSLFDGASNKSSTLLPSPIGIFPFPLPGGPTETVSRDTTSTNSAATRLSFGPLLPGCNSNFGFSTAQEDLAYEEFASHDSLDYSISDAFPSSASDDIVPPIPSLASDLHLRNFPISDRQPLEPHSAYFSALEGDSLMSRRSNDGPGHVHETSTSGSALELCLPTAEEAHHQIFWQENPSPRRPTVRIEVRNNVLQLDDQRVMGQESFTYACKSLPYDAGFRPHAYVDNHEYTIHGKHHLEALAEDLYAAEEFMEEEDYVMDKSKRPKVFRKLMEGKRMSKLMALGPLKFQKTPKQFSAHSCVTSSQSPALLFSANLADRNTVTADYPDSPNRPPTLPSSSPPPPSSLIPNKKKHRALFRMAWSGSRPLSMFMIPKPRVEGKVVPSPRELPMSLPAGENPPPFSPTSPQMHNVRTPGADVHGRSYGPSRVTSPDPPPRCSDPSILGRKERRSWLTNIRSPKINPPVT